MVKLTRKTDFKKYYLKVREEVLNVRELLSKNLLITIISIVFLYMILPYIARYILPHIWEYVQNIEYLGIEGGPLEDLVQTIATTTAGFLSYSIVYLMRILRFILLSVLLIMGFYLLLYLVFSILINHKIKFHTIVIATILSAIIAYFIAYIFMSNVNDSMRFLIQSAIDITEAQNIFNGDYPDVQTFVLDLFYGFYWGFIMLFLSNMIINIIVQYISTKIK